MAELKAITPRAYELIRDKIGLILATELPKQALLNADTRLNSTVFVERFVPVEDSEILDAALVIVSLSDSSFGLETNYTVDGEFTFYIDCYEKAKATATNKADERASFRLQRIAGVIHGILSDSQFNTLKFVAPFIENTTIKSIKIADPKNSTDASSVVMARLEFVVRAAESKQLIDPVPIAEYSTQAILGLTDLGYTYGEFEMPAVSPICADSIIQINGTQVVSAESGATVNIPVKDDLGEIVGSWNGNEFVVPCVISQISYVRDNSNRGVVQYQLYDLRWYINNTNRFTYTTNGIKPILDPNDETRLLTVNHFGNYLLGTNNLGGTVYDGSDGSIPRYIIHHILGKGFHMDLPLTSPATWPDTALEIQTFSDKGFSDWNMMTIVDIDVLRTGDGSTNFLTDNGATLPSFYVYTLNVNSSDQNRLWSHTMSYQLTSFFDNGNTNLNIDRQAVLCRNHHFN